MEHKNYLGSNEINRMLQRKTLINPLTRARVHGDEVTSSKGDQQERVLQSDWMVSGLSNCAFVQPDLSELGDIVL